MQEAENWQKKYSCHEYFFPHRRPICYTPFKGIRKRRIKLDRDSVLQATRKRFEKPIGALLTGLEATLRDLAKVKHMDLEMRGLLVRRSTPRFTAPWKPLVLTARD